MQKLLYIVVHLLFWTTFSMLSWMTISTNPGEATFIHTNPSAAVILGFWALVNFYSFYLYMQPLFLDSRKFITYFFISVGFSLLSSFVFVSIFWSLYESFRPYASQKFFESILGTFLISQCGSLLKGFVSWNQSLQHHTELENQSLKNELSMLKAQLSPHFLFNTLNNIDTLIYKSQDEASTMLIRLSELLRYMLYESESKETPIENEFEYLQQLTDLQRLRFEKRDYVKLDIVNRNSDLTIAPLLLLPFVENAFKFVSRPNSLPAIKIHIAVNNRQIHFRCTNYFNPLETTPKRSNGGIGLINARRRLELLYPNRFVLNIEKINNQFIVDLQLVSL